MDMTLIRCNTDCPAYTKRKTSMGEVDYCEFGHMTEYWHNYCKFGYVEGLRWLVLEDLGKHKKGESRRK